MHKIKPMFSGANTGEHVKTLSTGLLSVLHFLEKSGAGRDMFLNFLFTFSVKYVDKK